MFTDIQHTFVRVHHHLQIRIGVCHVDERLVLVAVFVKADGLLFSEVAVEIDRGQNPSREVASDRDEVQFASVARRKGVQGLPISPKCWWVNAL